MDTDRIIDQIRRTDLRCAYSALARMLSDEDRRLDIGPTIMQVAERWSLVFPAAFVWRCPIRGVLVSGRHLSLRWWGTSNGLAELCSTGPTANTEVNEWLDCQPPHGVPYDAIVFTSAITAPALAKWSEIEGWDRS